MKQNQKFILAFCLVAWVVVLSTPSCMHQPIGMPADPTDTTEVIDTTKTDTTPVDPGPQFDSTGVPCDSNIVYFEKDILPILRQNCAYSGCHGGGSSAEGVNLENYAKTISTGKVRAFNTSGSELYKVITTTKQKDLMPPPPNAKLTTDQINLIAKWINQGAKNEICNPNYGQPVACADHGVTYSGFVQKIVNNQCVACHKASNPSGGVRLDSYDAVLTSVQNGGFLGSIEGKPTFTKMPYNANSLDTCTVNKIKNWISNGAKND